MKRKGPNAVARFSSRKKAVRRESGTAGGYVWAVAWPAGPRGRLGEAGEAGMEGRFGMFVGGKARGSP